MQTMVFVNPDETFATLYVLLTVDQAKFSADNNVMRAHEDQNFTQGIPLGRVCYRVFPDRESLEAFVAYTIRLGEKDENMH